MEGNYRVKTGLFLKMNNNMYPDKNDSVLREMVKMQEREVNCWSHIFEEVRE